MSTAPPIPSQSSLEPTWHAAPGMPPIPCLPGVSGRCRICELIDHAHPDYSEGHRRRFHPEEFPAVLAPAGPVAAPASGLPPPGAVAPGEAPAPVPLAENLARHRRVDACPDRGEKVLECGCDTAHRCALGRGSVAGQPTHDECLACVDARPEVG